MDKVTYIKDAEGNEHAIINHGNGEFTSMLKSTYDASLEKPSKVVDEAAPE